MERFTKEEADETAKALSELFDALPKSKKMQYLGHLNDIGLFISAAKEHAPVATPVEKAQEAQP
jgi:hypothetical protein